MRASTLVLLLVLGICMGQLPRSNDFSEYLRVTAECAKANFQYVPYPSGVAHLGDHFHSPIVTLLLTPLTWLPRIWAKALWALLNAAGVIYIFRKFTQRPLPLATAVFFLCAFTHPLSDVFLSANFNFTLFLCLVAAWDLFSTKSRTAHFLGGLLVALGTFIKIMPVLWIPWMIACRRYREAAYITLGHALLIAATWIVMPWELGVRWWQGWVGSLSLYHQAAYIGGESYHSPTATVFRYANIFGVSYDRAYLLAQIVAWMFFLGMNFYAFHLYRRGASPRKVLAVLVSPFFLGNPFSWALTILFIFPIVALRAQRGIGWLAWGAAILYAAIPKALWPESAWLWIVGWGVPGFALGSLALWAFLTDGEADAQRSMLSFEGQIQTS